MSAAWWARALRWLLGHYTSTACMHGEHARCRQTCKFCGADCRCSCHRRNLDEVMV